MNQKRILSMAVIALVACGNADAQNVLGRLAERAKSAAENAVSNKIENAISGAIDNVGKKKGKKDKNNDNAETATDNTSAKSSTWVCPECGKAGNTGDFCGDCGAKRPAGATAQDPTIATSTDFKRGSVILFLDDFASETVGEFPSKWELNNGGSVEVKTLDGVKAVEITNGGYITPLIKQEGAYLTEEFTVEFSYYYWPSQEDAGLDYVGANDIKLYLNSDTDRSRSEEYVIADEKRIAFSIGFPVCDSPNVSYAYYNGKKPIDGSTKYKLTKGWHNVQVSFNKRALKVYIDGNRIVNLPQVAQATWMAFQVPYNYSNLTFIKDVVIAQGAVELYDRNAQDITAVEKSMQETGKFVTNNILFDTGKATLKPESMTDIRMVADYMKKNPSARFEVQGHCDNTGSAATNDKLSQQRAEAIVAELVKLGVDEWNLRAVGKGSHEPVADNSTEAGRAKNRRVEFIKK
ncbi:MAG: OmpA family protein [Bacteroidales bacterium]|nr:OmpA family protein [Bacteroidales bacterium]